ncbi:hypothetical protein GPECTOR_11g221 [Gonium pectorale]|uniref:Uncharacterized protein n=1 Tax=Gonium pectorale TaxID=33097 RepID=A0A150GPW4_GONPE|nr:hypothetical protein GPECTOR_11g221 [Gonium pectorale]|eukprot:KXZ51778.1 hypothetical protein GPECTOR_11g221 [Gonium pectorale]
MAGPAALGERAFKSNLTRYAKNKVANRDNFQRWRESGRDVRVAQEILREGAGAGRPSRRSGGSGAPQGAMGELWTLLMECRDLLELQVVVRECGRDMSGPVLCVALSRLHKLKQATPDAAAPGALARRIAELLMPRLQERIHETKASNLGAALSGLSDCGIAPGQALLAVVTQRLVARSPRGGRAILESDPRALSSLLHATGRMMQAQRQAQAEGPNLSQAQHSGAGAGSSVPAPAAVAGEGEAGPKNGGDVLREELWPALLSAAESKLLRALGEEPHGAPAVPVGGEDGPEVDDSIPQAVLRSICKALSQAHESHPGVWSAAARLAARHAGELQPAVAAAVLRSYAMAGGAALDGGREGLLEAIWGVLQPRLAELDAEALTDLTLAVAGLATASSGAAGAVATAEAARQALRPLCDALVPRLPSLSSNKATCVAAALAKAHGAAAAAAAEDVGAGATPAMSATFVQRHSFGALPRLLADMVLLRGPTKFGNRDYPSIVLALALLEHSDGAFWQQVAAASLPELPRMDGGSLGRLLGAFYHAFRASAADGVAVSAPEPAAPAEAQARASVPPVPVPALVLDAGFVTAAHARVAALLGAGGLTDRETFFILQSLAVLPMPEGGASTLSALADRLMAAALAGDDRWGQSSAQGAARLRLAVALRAAGLGDHPLMARLEGLGQ